MESQTPNGEPDDQTTECNRYFVHRTPFSPARLPPDEQGFDSALKPLVKTPFTIITKDNLNQPAVQQAVYSF